MEKREVVLEGAGVEVLEGAVLDAEEAVQGEGLEEVQTSGVVAPRLGLGSFAVEESGK